MTTVLLIRHGQSVTNVTQVFTGHYDVPLSPLGQEQARRTAAYLRGHFAIDAIYASDLMRAMQTAHGGGLRPAHPPRARSARNLRRAVGAHALCADRARIRPAIRLLAARYRPLRLPAGRKRGAPV